MNNEKKKKIIIAVKSAVVIFCTAIGGYGILRAPESDRAELEQSLKQNEQELQKQLAQNPQKEGETPKKTKEPKQEIITVIGDSVFLGAAPSFQKLVNNTVIDAKISRQVCQALDVAKKLKKENKLGNTVILSLGINGKFNPATGQELIDFLGTDRTIYWVNAFGKEKDIQKDVNKTIRNLSKKYSNLYVIPWADEAKKHPEWFYQDGTHLNEKGQPEFARFVQKNMTAQP